VLEANAPAPLECEAVDQREPSIWPVSGFSSHDTTRYGSDLVISALPELLSLDVLIVEDEWVVAKDIERIVKLVGCNVVGIATKPEQALDAAKRREIDLVLMDISLGAERDGIDLVVDLKRNGDIGIIFVSAHGDAGTVSRAARVRPDAFILKPFTENQLRIAVEVVVERLSAPPASAGSTIPSAAEQTLKKIVDVLAEAGSVVPPASLPRRSVPEVALLSKREAEILEALLSNRRIPSIARLLHISPHTVRNHLKSIYQKLDVHSQEELLDKLLHGREG
jgi:DNA-binding NarL/FixJ family response regulator